VLLLFVLHLPLRLLMFRKLTADLLDLEASCRGVRVQAFAMVLTCCSCCCCLGQGSGE
jgi:hypothetical protein